MEFVLIRFSSLGDVVLQTPLAAFLKCLYPNCKITFLTSEAFKSLVENHPYIDEVKTIKRLRGREDREQLKKLSSEIDQKTNAIVFDLHGTLRAKLIRFYLKKSPCIQVPKRTLLRKILVTFKINLLKNLPTHHERVIRDFLFLFENSKSLEEIIDFNKSHTLGQSFLTTLPQSFEKKKTLLEHEYVVISPVASFLNKRWPINLVRKWIHLFLADEKLTHYHLVLLAGPDDTYCRQLMIDNERWHNLQGETSLEQTIHWMSGAKLCVANDTGTTHIAEALGVPSITLFGPTHESFGFRTHLPKSTTISLPLSCRPCSATGAKPCSQKSLLCMEGIKPEVVLEKVKELL